MKDKAAVIKELRNELSQLTNKITNLKIFIYEDSKFIEISSIHLRLLEIQLKSMETYREILLTRLLIMEKEIQEKSDLYDRWTSN